MLKRSLLLLLLANGMSLIAMERVFKEAKITAGYPEEVEQIEELEEASQIERAISEIDAIDAKEKLIQGQGLDELLTEEYRKTLLQMPTQWPADKASQDKIKLNIGKPFAQKYSALTPQQKEELFKKIIAENLQNELQIKNRSLKEKITTFTAIIRTGMELCRKRNVLEQAIHELNIQDAFPKARL